MDRRLTYNLGPNDEILSIETNGQIFVPASKLGTLEIQLKNLSEHAAGFAAERNAALRRLDSLKSLAEDLRMKCAIEDGHSHCQLCTHSLSEPPDAEDRAYCYFARLNAAVVERQAPK